MQWYRRILIQRSCTSATTRSSEILHKGTEILHKCYDRIRTQVIQKNPNTEILYKWSYRILIQVVYQDPHTEILKCKPPILILWSRNIKCYYRILIQGLNRYKWSYRILIQVAQNDPHRDLAQVAPQNPDTLVQKGSGYSGPEGSRYRDLAQAPPQDPDTVVQKDPDTKVLRNCYHKILIQWSKMESLTERSCTRDPHTES